MRRALGATTGDVIGLVVGSAVRVIAAGAVVGLVVSAVLGRLLFTMLFRVEPFDPATFVGDDCAGRHAAVSIAGPAWRATRIHPAVALRSE